MAYPVAYRKGAERFAGDNRQAGRRPGFQGPRGRLPAPANLPQPSNDAGHPMRPNPGPQQPAKPPRLPAWRIPYAPLGRMARRLAWPLRAIDAYDAIYRYEHPEAPLVEHRPTSNAWWTHVQTARHPFPYAGAGTHWSATSSGAMNQGQAISPNEGQPFSQPIGFFDVGTEVGVWQRHALWPDPSRWAQTERFVWTGKRDGWPSPVPMQPVRYGYGSQAQPAPYPDWVPAISPEVVPVGAPAPRPQPVPYRAIPTRQPSPYRDAKEQTQRGPGPSPRYAVAPRPGESPATQIVAEPGKATTVATRPHVRKPPAPGTKERKAHWMNTGAGRAVAFGINAYTESDDLFDAFHEALPPSLQHKPAKGKRSHPWEKAAQVYKHWDDVDLNEALQNWAMNQAEDLAIGKAAQATQRNFKPFLDATGRPAGFGIGPAL